MRLQTYLLGVISATLCSSILLYGAYSAQHRVEQAASEMQGITRTVATGLANAVAAPMLLGDIDQIELLLLRFSGLPQLLEAQVINNRGQILSRVIRDQRGLRPAAADQPSLAVPPPIRQAYPSTEHADWQVLIPIEAGETIGWVQLRANAEPLRQIQREIWRSGLFLALVALALSGGLLILVLRPVIKRIEQATRFAQQLLQANVCELPLSSRVNEIDSLAHALRQARTELQQRHDALSESENRKSAILASALDAIITIDSQARIIDFNPAAEDMFGYLSQEVMGKRIDDLIIPPEARAAHARGMAHYLATGDGPLLNRRAQVNAMRQGGATFPVEIAIIPVMTLYGPCFSATLRDLTELKALEAARERARELELSVGEHIQHTLLQGELPALPDGLQAAVVATSSQRVGGDFYECFSLSPNCTDFIIGDIMGKGVPAALLGAAAKMALNRVVLELIAQSATAGEQPDPAQIVTRFHQQIAPHLLEIESFLTLNYVRVDQRTRRMTWVGCGHTEALLLHPDGQTRRLPNQNMPIGIMRDCDYQQSEIDLAAGSKILLYSDGATEVDNQEGESLGDAGLIKFWQALNQQPLPAYVSLLMLQQEIRNFAAGQIIRDDLTLLTIQLLPAHCLHQRKIRVRRELGKIEDVRQMVATYTRQNNLPDECAIHIELGLVELFTNIVRHNPSTTLADNWVEIELQAYADHSALFLSYRGDAFVSPEVQYEQLKLDNEGGFGLFIINNCFADIRHLHQSGHNVTSAIKPH